MTSRGNRVRLMTAVTSLMVIFLLRSADGRGQLGFLSVLEDVVRSERKADDSSTEAERVTEVQRKLQQRKTGWSNEGANEGITSNDHCIDGINPMICRQAKQLSFCSRRASLAVDLCRSTCGYCAEQTTNGGNLETRSSQLLDDEETAMDHILTVNEAQDLHLQEGDIAVPPTDNDDLRTKRNAMTDHGLLWPGRVVPYTIDPSAKIDEAVIKEAFREIETHTCLRFVPHSKQRDHINIFRGTGCWSMVGRFYAKAGPQNLSLGPGCGDKGTIVHELIHALGFLHEQSRPDRNQYVEVMWENIRPGSESNFDKYSRYSVENHVNYDYNSVMHYGSKSFSINGKPTMKVIGSKNVTLGQRTGLSTLDAVEINALYRCNQASSSWSSWSSYSPCDVNCKKTRQAFCTDSSEAMSCKSANPSGIITQTADCAHAECYAPIDGHWGRWSAWSYCTASCGLGTTMRSRLCDDPQPSNGGQDCNGDSQETKGCTLEGCGAEKYSCSFDLDLCEWNLEVRDRTGWYRRYGPTTSKNTGPPGDHTTGTEYYVYYEGSAPAKTDKPRSLYSNTIPAGTGDRCLSAWYSMYGVAMGTLTIIQENKVAMVNKTLHSLSGDQGPGWHHYEVTIDGTFDQKIYFEAARGYDYRSDIAIDDIKVQDGRCGAPVPMTTAAPAAMTTAFPLTSTAAPCSALLPLGMETRQIKNFQLSASSEYDVNHQVQLARLHQQTAWCANHVSQFEPQFIRVDFYQPTFVWVIATQGYPLWDNWVTEYHIEVSQDGATFHPFTHAGQTVVFQGNSDRNSMAANKLSRAVTVLSIKLIPTKWHGNDLCLRLELYGCDAPADTRQPSCSTATRPAGLASHTLPNSNIVSSSVYSLNHVAFYGRLNSYGSWCADPRQQAFDQYIQIDLGRSVLVVAIATQGQPTWDNWVTNYKLKLSDDNSFWRTYAEKYVTKVFSANKDRNSIVKHFLPTAQRTRYLQIVPQNYHGNDMCLRAEVFICD